jgi:N-acetylmuramoyl-L-alanine amidase
VKLGKTDEAAYTLELAKKLAEALKRAGLDARLTREDDSSMSAASRTALAGALGAQALVSLHVNSSFNTQARGLRVFVPAPGPVDESQAPLWEQAARLQAAASRALGQQLAGALGEAGGRSVQSLKLALFRGLSVPGAQVELDYASNPEGLAALRDQESLAAKLAQGITAFIGSRASAEGSHGAP